MTVKDLTAEEALVETYLDAAGTCYRLAKAEHASNLRAEKSEYPSWEAGPVHAFSRAIGAFEALRELVCARCPEWLEEPLWLDRYSLREAARQDAVEEFEQERYEDWAMKMRLERRQP